MRGPKWVEEPRHPSPENGLDPLKVDNIETYEKVGVEKREEENPEVTGLTI